MVQDCPRWCKMVQYGLRWSEMVQDGLKWYTNVHDGPRFQNGQRCLKHSKKYIIQTYVLSAKGVKAGGK